MNTPLPLTALSGFALAVSGNVGVVSTPTVQVTGTPKVSVDRTVPVTAPSGSPLAVKGTVRAAERGRSGYAATVMCIVPTGQTGRTTTLLPSWAGQLVVESVAVLVRAPADYPPADVQLNIPASSNGVAARICAPLRKMSSVATGADTIDCYAGSAPVAAYVDSTGGMTGDFTLGGASLLAAFDGSTWMQLTVTGHTVMPGGARSLRQGDAERHRRESAPVCTRPGRSPCATG